MLLGKIEEILGNFAGKGKKTQFFRQSAHYSYK